MSFPRKRESSINLNEKYTTTQPTNEKFIIYGLSDLGALLYSKSNVRFQPVKAYPPAGGED